MAIALGPMALAVWTALAWLAWRVQWRESAPPAAPRRWSRVVAIVPARDEADVIGKAVASLAAQQYGGEFHVVVVDDASSDGTAEAARAAAPARLLTVVPANPLPTAWSGKVWALSEGIRRAAAREPDYFLFTDADIVHPTDAVASLVARAEAGYDLVSYMVTLSCRTAAERALIPAFAFFFFLLYPPGLVAGAAGGCILMRRAALEAIGGIERIRGELIDDCALARAVKRAGGRVWLAPSAKAQSIREYATFGAIGRMISRTAFTQLRHSVLALAGVVAGLTLVFLGPPELALHGSWTGALAYLAMGAAYFPALRFYNRSGLWAPLLPLVAMFYAGATIHSAVAYFRGAGGTWKGRVQDSKPTV
jgi:hopene-associated glycosyltransferase HpnB